MKPWFNKESIENTQIFYDRLHELQLDLVQFWLKTTFLKWPFWVGLFLAVVPWLSWIKYHKKESRDRLLYAGFFVIIASLWLDFLGTTFGKWMYAGKIIPILPAFFPYDFCLMPVVVMFFIQIKPNASPFLKGIIFAGVTAFIGESIFKILGIYKELDWNSFYSFPIYLIIYLIADWLAHRTHFEEIDKI